MLLMLDSLTHTCPGTVVCLLLFSFLSLRGFLASQYSCLVCSFHVPLSIFHTFLSDGVAECYLTYEAEINITDSGLDILNSFLLSNQARQYLS
jgi:hypothetical protein